MKILTLVLIILTSAKVFAVNTSRNNLLAVFEKVLPNKLCDTFTKCYGTTKEVCQGKARQSVKTCIAEFRDKISDPVIGEQSGAKWGSQIGGCAGKMLVNALNEFANDKTDQCLNAAATNPPSLTQEDKEAALNQISQGRPIFGKFLIKLGPEEANQFLSIMRGFPHLKDVPPQMHATLWTLIKKMDLKNSGDVEILKNQTLGYTLNNQVLLWEDALAALKEGRFVKSPARKVAEDQINEVSPKPTDFKGDDKLVESIALKKPIDMGSKSGVYDEAKVKQMIAHLKEKQNQLDHLFQP